MTTLPKQTGDIFEILSKGHFICWDSTQESIRRLHRVIEEDKNEELKEYFSRINFVLEAGDGYYHFTRTESRAELERKIETAYRWIDIIDFLKTYDNSFGAGYRFTPSDILVRINVDAVLKSKMEGLRKHSKGDNFDNSLQKIIDMMVKDSFMELENEISCSYKVLSSFKYLEQLILNIHIPEEVRNEIPE